MQLDSFQQPVADRLAQIASDLEHFERIRSWRRRVLRFFLRREARTVKGLYIWGGVGRGKTCLMDRFFAQVRIKNKTRMHFHQFMLKVHEQLTVHSATENPLHVISNKLARNTRLLCFDEFVVSDIGDAMILSELLKHMFDKGMVLVATSNIEPKKLYDNGLQRRRFLPAIELLQKNCEVVHLNGPIDYRLRVLRRTELYRIGTVLTPELWAQDLLLLGGSSSGTTSLLYINHREIQTVFSTQGVVGFTFVELCVAPRSAADYIEIARLFHTLFVYEIPQLTSSLEDATTRFVALVDVLYDYNVNLVVQAETGIADLYVGIRSKLEFERTASRIIEMASEDFLSRAHRA